jgi:hypothetical protein
VSENEIPVPDFVGDIDEATINAAAAVVEGNGGLLEPPADAVVSTDDKGNKYERWTEGVVIEAAYREVTKAEKPEDRLMVVVLQMKVRAGYPNQHDRTWTRLMLSPQILANQKPGKPGHTPMHERSMGCITTLLRSTGLAPKTGGLPARLLNFVFPAGKNGKSPLVGKEAIANLCNQPNSGKNAKKDRQTKAESFLPDPAAVTVEK